MERPRLLIADKNGKVFDVPYLEPAGMKAGDYYRIPREGLVRLHPDSEIFILPQRRPVAYSPTDREFVHLTTNPLIREKEECYAVAAFLAPGFTATFSAAYREGPGSGILPMFSYAPVCLYKGRFFTAAVRVDLERRHELDKMDANLLRKNVGNFKKMFPGNRLIRHLEICALTYGCPAAKNFFLQRYEAPLPTSTVCNASCIGCITFQPADGCPITQPRIAFTPEPSEVIEAALYHIDNVTDPVVSFGQGCEGEPLMRGDLLEKVVKGIRKVTPKGMINLNTNASMPGVIAKLFDAGLDSIRVSINSVRAVYYKAYYRPRGYSLRDVKRSINEAKKRGGFVSLNYLVIPGFTDIREEAEELAKFIEKNDIDMIQWRNLNYDPKAYFRKLRVRRAKPDMVGIDNLIGMVSSKYPGLMHGYFNPSRGRIYRWRNRIKRLF